MDIPTYHRVTLDAVYTSDLEYFDFDSDMEPMVISRAMAREPWNAAYFQKLRYYILYSESQIYEYIARAHEMSSSKLIFKCITTVTCFLIGLHKKESCLDVRSFKELNTIYEDISKYHCSKS